MILDIVLLIILIIFALVGIKKGFLNTFINLVGVVLSVGVAIFTCKYVAGFLDNMFKLTKTFTNMLVPQLKGMGDIMKTQITNASELSDLSGVNAQGKFAGPLTNIIKKLIQGNEEKIVGSTPAEYVGGVLGGFATVVAAAILIFIAVRVVLRILSRIFKSKGPRTVNGMDKALGLFCGLAQGLIFVGIILTAAFVLYNIPATTEFVSKAFDGSKVSLKVYNIFEDWLEKVMTNAKTIEFIQKLINKA